MLLWFAAGSVAIVWAVFQSPAIDYRMVMLGSVLGVLETPWGPGPLHTLIVPTLVLGIVMLATRGRRLLRRRWLGLPIGMYLFVVLDFGWLNSDVFWWPFSGWSFPDEPAPIVDRGVWSLVLEAIGIALAVFLWSRFGLDDVGRRQRFLRTGQLDRSFVSRGSGE
ncbi:MAG TPA: hypothetical protein VJM33_04680 [Microthrixaceae bacterium]|nr:hypothetical protein [Microthrixaceae bacterium]